MSRVDTEVLVLEPEGHCYLEPELNKLRLKAQEHVSL